MSGRAYSRHAIVVPSFSTVKSILCPHRQWHQTAPRCDSTGLVPCYAYLNAFTVPDSRPFMTGFRKCGEKSKTGKHNWFFVNKTPGHRWPKWLSGRQVLGFPLTSEIWLCETYVGRSHGPETVGSKRWMESLLSPLATSPECMDRWKTKKRPDNLAKDVRSIRNQVIAPAR